MMNLRVDFVIWLYGLLRRVELFYRWIYRGQIPSAWEQELDRLHAEICLQIHIYRWTKWKAEEPQRPNPPERIERWMLTIL